jgi:hypothetical protein
VAGEGEAGAVRRLRSRAHDKVGLAPVRGEPPLQHQARAVEVVGDEIDEGKVAEMARGVERDELLQQCGIGQPRVITNPLGSRAAPISGGSTLMTTRRECLVSVARKTRLIPPPPSSFRTW